MVYREPTKSAEGSERSRELGCSRCRTAKAAGTRSQGQEMPGKVCPIISRTSRRPAKYSVSSSNYRVSAEDVRGGEPSTGHHHEAGRTRAQYFWKLRISSRVHANHRDGSVISLKCGKRTRRRLRSFVNQKRQASGEIISNIVGEDMTSFPREVNPERV